MTFIIRVLLIPFYLVKVLFFLAIGVVALAFSLFRILFGQTTIAEVSKNMDEWLTDTFKWFE